MDEMRWRKQQIRASSPSVMSMALMIWYSLPKKEDEAISSSTRERYVARADLQVMPIWSAVNVKKKLPREGRANSPPSQLQPFSFSLIFKLPPAMNFSRNLYERRIRASSAFRWLYLSRGSHTGGAGAEVCLLNMPALWGIRVIVETGALQGYTSVRSRVIGGLISS